MIRRDFGVQHLLAADPALDLPPVGLRCEVRFFSAFKTPAVEVGESLPVAVFQGVEIHPRVTLHLVVGTRSVVVAEVALRHRVLPAAGVRISGALEEGPTRERLVVEIVEDQHHADLVVFALWCAVYLSASDRFDLRDVGSPRLKRIAVT